MAISSISGFLPAGGQAAYGAAKAGLNHYLRILGTELRPRQAVKILQAVTRLLCCRAACTAAVAGWLECAPSPCKGQADESSSARPGSLHSVALLGDCPAASIISLLGLV